MSENIDKPAEETAEKEAAGPVGGERLAEARRVQQISVFEIAKELHLDEPKVRALERNDFNVLGAPVFAKGHMRKYARLVGVDIDDVLADYYRMERSSHMPPVVPGRPRIKEATSPGPWIVAIIVILAAMAAYWFLVLRSTPPVISDSEPAQQEAQSAVAVDDTPLFPDDAIVLDAVAEPEALAISEVADESPPPMNDDTIVQANDTAIDQARDNGQLRLGLNFSGECWTEISDADGRRLFFGMGRDGRSVELSGKAPFSVLFGDAENVSVRVNGNDYTIPAADRRGRTARLTLTSP